MSTNYDLKYTTKDIGNHIIKLRVQKKMSSYKLAVRCNMNPSVLMRIEKGEREPYLTTFLRILEGLEITPIIFFESIDTEM
jgi:transcriptional regulator with XRE-family HTH domain